MEHQYIVVDGVLTPDSSLSDLIPEGKVVYEVVRLIDGKPLFWHDHFLRLVESCRIAQLNFGLPSGSFTKAIRDLVIANNIQSVNCKIEVFMVGGLLHYRLLVLPSHYPDQNLYATGISLGFLHEERQDPNAKVVNASVRSKADRLIKEGDYYEVLLVNGKGEITEGSRSNVFFIKGSTLITPPVVDVLPGITRYQVLKIAQKLEIPIVEVAVNVSDVSDFDLMFITGTSPMLLPASRVGNLNYNPDNAIFKSLLNEYRQNVANDLNTFDY